MSDIQDSVELRVPGAAGRHFIIEFPGYVQNQEAVLATLNGTEGISRQLQDNASMIPLRLRPDDPLCHPIRGERHRTSSLILKLTRPKQQQPSSTTTDTSSDQQHDQPSTKSYSAEIVATADAVYRFTSPADYQYLGRDLRPPEVKAASTAASLEEGPQFLPQQPLLCAPPLFAKQQEYDYAYGALDERDGAGGGSKKFSISIGFFSPQAEVPPPLESLPEVREGLRVLQQRISDLLTQRPIWTGAALHASAPEGTTRTTIDELLPRLCYRFKNGPWKYAWVRRGYDPRLDPSSRKYQVTEYQLPSEWYDRIARQKQDAPDIPVGLPPLAESYRQLVAFTAVPNTHNTYLQLCDIEDPEVQELLGNGRNYQGQCSDATGWLQPAAWEELKKKVRARFLAVLEDGSKYTSAEQGNGQVAQPPPSVPMEVDHSLQQQAQTQQVQGEGPTAINVQPAGASLDSGDIDGASLEQILAQLSGLNTTNTTTNTTTTIEPGKPAGVGGLLNTMLLPESRLPQIIAAEAVRAGIFLPLHLGGALPYEHGHEHLGSQLPASKSYPLRDADALHSEDEGGGFSSEEEGFEDEGDDYAESEDE